MIDPVEIIQRYYPTDSLGYRILRTHSEQVAQLALAIVAQHPELECDERFVYEAAMLHDIGVYKTDAPSIGCYGTEPYLRHGYLGGLLLRSLGLERHALVAERHTGTGLDAETIRARQLDLPTDRTYMPESIEEQVVCYADKFYSKTHLSGQKPLERVRASLAKYGEASLARFDSMHQRFVVPEVVCQKSDFTS